MQIVPIPKSNIVVNNLKRYVPNQAVMNSKAGGIWHWQRGLYKLTMKNGVQQAMKVPVMMANVRQAFLSRLFSADSFGRRRFLGSRAVPVTPLLVFCVVVWKQQIYLFFFN